MRRWAIALGGITMLVGLGLIWAELRGKGSAPRAALPALAAGAISSAPDATELERPLDVAPAANSGAPSSEERAPTQRLELLVVDRDTGLAIEGAEIGVLPFDSADSVDALELGGVKHDFAGLARARGLFGVSDREGGAAFDLPVSRIVVEGHSDRRWGRIELDYVPRRVVRLELAQEPGLEVRVTEAPGAPVRGVRVQLGALHARGGWAVRDCVRTDELGHARFAHVDRNLGPEERLAARLVLVSARTVQVAVDASTLTPVALELPPCGAVEIDLRDAVGMPVTNTRVSLATALSGPRAIESLVPDTFQKGRARWSFVEPGTGLTAFAWSAEHHEARAQIEALAGPGRTVRRELVLHSLPELAGRMLGPDGRAVANTRFLEIAGGELGGSSLVQERSRREFVTDAEGRFRHGVDLHWDAFASVEFRGEVFVYRELGSGARPPLGAHVSRARGAGLLAAETHAAETLTALPSRDLPVVDIHLEPLPCVVAGRVVDADGVPLPDVLLRCRAQPDPRTGTTAPFAGEARSDELGCFWFEGTLASGPLHLSASRAGFLALERQVSFAGASGVEIVLHAHAALAGRYRFAPDVPVDELVVRVRPHAVEGVSTPEGESQAPVGAEGRWKHAGRAPGLYDVALTLRTGTTPIHVVEEIRIDSGVVTRDRRLADVDLHDVLRPCALEVVDARTRGALSGTAVFYALDGGRQSTYPIEDGRARALLVRPPLILDVFVPGYRPCVLEGVDGDRRVELRRGLAVRLSIDPRVVLPSYPAQLQCELEPVLDLEQAPNPVTCAILERRLAAVDDLVMSFDPTSARGIDFQVPYPGRYRVVFRVQDIEVGREVPVESGVGANLLVAEGEGAQSFELLPDEEALRAACQALRKGPR